MCRVLDGGLVPAVPNGEIATHHVVGENAQAPEVSCSSVPEGVMNFGGHVDQGTATGHALVVRRFHLKDFRLVFYDNT